LIFWTLNPKIDNGIAVSYLFYLKKCFRKYNFSFNGINVFVFGVKKKFYFKLLANADVLAI